MATKYAAALLLFSSCVIAAGNDAKPCDFTLPVTECNGEWKILRYFLHPAQQAVGYAAVKRKLDDDFKTEKKSRKSMENSPLPYVLGPDKVPFLIDSHHTSRALEESGYDHTNVTFQMICDWSYMSSYLFYETMIEKNFMAPLGRRNHQDFNEIPKRIDPTTHIPGFIELTIDDPWRSFGALVRKVTSNNCKSGRVDCLRGYNRTCEANGHLTPFFEFRWAYFFNDAYVRGCDDENTSLWDDREDCEKFEEAYKKLPLGQPIPKIDLKPWMEAAELLVPLCRGNKAGEYILPEDLGPPYGGKKLPGYVKGKDTQIDTKDPECSSPECPILPLPMDNLEEELYSFSEK
jgi:hypothetical protein